LIAQANVELLTRIGTPDDASLAGGYSLTHLSPPSRTASSIIARELTSSLSFKLLCWPKTDRASYGGHDPLISRGAPRRPKCLAL